MKLERRVFEKLKSLKNDALQDTVILHSTEIMANLKSKNNYREFDFLIFSWKRRLIIAIETKRSLTEKAFDQLQKCHELLVKT